MALIWEGTGGLDMRTLQVQGPQRSGPLPARDPIWVRVAGGGDSSLPDNGWL